MSRADIYRTNEVQDGSGGGTIPGATAPPLGVPTTGTSGVLCHTSVASSVAIATRGLAFGGIRCPASLGSTTALLAYGCLEPNGTYGPIYDATGAAVSITPVAGAVLALPDACFCFPYLKFQGTGASMNIVFWGSA